AAHPAAPRQGGAGGGAGPRAAELRAAVVGRRFVIAPTGVVDRPRVARRGGRTLAGGDLEPPKLRDGARGRGGRLAAGAQQQEGGQRGCQQDGAELWHVGSRFRGRGG